jgi:hypothetical protein
LIGRETLRNLVAVLICALLLGCLIPSAPSVSGAGPLFISGLVIDGEGVPLVGVNVSAADTSSGLAYYSTTNDTGVFNISLPTGTYNITAIRANYTSNVTYHNVLVGLDGVNGIDFTLTEILGTVFGFVTSGNASVGGVAITLSNADHSFHSQSQLPFGLYSMNGVAPGVYIAKAEKNGYFTAYAPNPVIVSRGHQVQVNFSMEVQPARVFGTVSVSGTPVADVTVELLLNGVAIRQAQKTDASGNYSFANLQSGEYQLHLSKEGLVDKIVPVSLQSFEDKRVDQVMSRTPVEGLKGFIGDLDLTHSLMIVAMLVTVILMAFAIFVRMRSTKNPDMLANEKKEEDEREEKLKKKCVRPRCSFSH